MLSFNVQNSKEVYTTYNMRSGNLLQIFAYPLSARERCEGVTRVCGRSFGALLSPEFRIYVTKVTTVEGRKRRRIVVSY